MHYLSGKDTPSTGGRPPLASHDCAGVSHTPRTVLPYMLFFFIHLVGPGHLVCSKPNVYCRGISTTCTRIAFCF